MASKELKTAEMGNKDKDDKSWRVEHASDIIGDWGPYQLRIFLTITSLYLVSPFHSKALVYYAPKVGFWCKQPEGYENATQQTCQSYENSNLACNEWEYDSSFFKSTIVQEYDLVCDRAWLVSMVQSCFQIGYLISSIFVGLFSDRFGRLTALKLCVVVEIISGILLVFAPNIYLFGILRIIGGTAGFGRFLSGYLLVMESVGPHLRGKMGVWSELGWSIGEMLQPGIYYLIRDYKHMQLCVLGFEALVCVFIWQMDESLRWLLTHGQFDTARKVIVKAAAEKGDLNVDQVESQLVLLKQFLDKDEELRKNEEKETLLDVYRVPQLLKYCLLLYVAWFVMGLVGYAMILNIGDLAGSLFVNSFVTAVAGTVSRLVLAVIVDRLSRRRLLSLSFLGAAASYMTMALVTNMDPIYTTSLAIFGSFFVASEFIMTYLYATEIFPTTVRQIGLGSCSVFSRMGSIAAPFFRELTAVTSLSTTLSIFGVLSLAAGSVVCFLPETQEKEIPDIISESTKETQSPQRV